MKKMLLLLVIAAVVVAVILYFSNSGETAEKHTYRTDTEGKAIVKDEVIPSGSEEQILTLNGNVVPAKTQSVVFKVDGILEKGEADLSKGSRFRKNQLLFQVNNSDAFLKLQEAKLTLKSKFEFILPKLTKDLPTEKPEWETYIATLEPVSLIGELPAMNLAEEQMLMNSFRIEEDHQLISKMEARMADYFYIAPFDGIVLEKTASTGQKIKRGQAVAQIGAPRKTHIKVIVDKDYPASRRNELKAGKMVKVMDKQNELIGTGKFVKSALLKDGSSEVYFTLETGRKLSLGTEVLVEVK